MDKLNSKITELISLCKKNKIKLATAESCTGGLISALITSISGSSEIFELSFVTYSNQSKIDLLKVDPKRIREFGAIVNGLPFALGTAVATGRPTTLFDGDGSFRMHVQELETIRRAGLPLISCIFNDGGYGSEFHKLRAENLREDGANFGCSDLSQIAEGFGIRGYRIDTMVQLHETLSELSKAPTAAVLDIRVSPTAMSPVIARSHGNPSKH